MTVAYVALGLSLFNLLIWVVVAIGIRKVFRKMIPMFQMMGISQSQNLQYSPVFDRIGGSDEIGDAESEGNISA